MRPWVWLPVGAWPFPFKALGKDSDALTPPWPELVISCGRRAVPYALAIKRRSKGRSFIAHIQDPRVDPARFDLVIAPRHDKLRGANVLETLGSLSRLTRAALDRAAAAWAPQLAKLPKPRVAVLIGGASRAYRLTPVIALALGKELSAFAQRAGVGLLVTTSRRTGAENERALREGLAGAPFVEPRGQDSYAAILGLADAVIVTADSVNMLSEGLIAGRPLLIASLPGGRSRIEALQEAGLR